MTAHPAFSGKLANQAAVSQRVVVDGPLTTSRGPGTAFEFALALVKQLYGDAKAQEVRRRGQTAMTFGQRNSSRAGWAAF